MGRRISRTATFLLGFVWAALGKSYVNQMTVKAKHHGVLLRRSIPR
jgi:hypothetical protein